MELIIRDTDYFTLTHDSEKFFAKLAWYGSPDADEYQNAFMSLLKLAREHPIKYFMSDVRKQGVIAPELRNWLNLKVLPIASKLGVEKVAVVYNAGPVKEYYLNHIIPEAKKLNLNIFPFKNVDAALAWLEEI